jgi:hypothetical protein
MTGTHDQYRAALESVRDAFTYMPALNDVGALPSWSPEDVRHEVNAALDACLPQVWSALDGASNDPPDKTTDT